jgi:hypothetical protein
MDDAPHINFVGWVRLLPPRVFVTQGVKSVGKTLQLDQQWPTSWKNSVFWFSRIFGGL